MTHSGPTRRASDLDIAAALVDPGVKILVQPLGDIWLRDTGPIIAGTGATRRARNFRFNWWGEKFVMPGDQEVGAALALTTGLPRSEEHTSELQSLMRISYAVVSLKKKKTYL